MSDRPITSKERNLQQQVMSFISAGVNTGLWNRDIAYDLVRQMLDANWQSPVETSPPGWKPIETLSPTQEPPTFVLIAERKPDGTYVVGEARYFEAGWRWAGNDPTDHWGREVYPTHWMPLPRPPSSAEETKGAGSAEQFERGYHAQKAPVKPTDVCPAFDHTPHEERKGKCIYCGAPMQSQSNGSVNEGNK